MKQISQRFQVCKREITKWSAVFSDQQHLKHIGLTIPGNWSFEIRRISPVKSGGFHPDFTREIWQISPVKSRVIAPLLHSSN